MESLPTRSAEGAAALDIFYDGFNDVNFYFEDADQENLYTRIVEKILPDLRIARIFPLTGKLSVIAHAVDPVNAKNEDFSIYVLDKDFDDLLGKMVIKRNIFYLSKYSIENFILHESSFVEIIIETHPKSRREDVKDMLRYGEFLAASVNDLRRLCALFLFVQSNNIPLRNCDTKPEEFSSNAGPWKVDIAKIDEYQDKVYDLAILAAAVQSRQQLDAYVDSCFPQGQVENNICGKFLLAMSFHFIKTHYPIAGMTHDSLTYRLVSKSPATSFADLGERILLFLATGGVITA